MHSSGIDGRTVERSEEHCIVVIGGAVSDDFACLDQVACKAMGGCQFLLGGQIKIKHSRGGAVPVVGNRCNAVVEVLMVILQHGDTFHKTSLINLPPVSIRYLNIRHESDPNWYGPL